ncbi:hypothetical protein LSTR_LSTR002669 [Laodelphax striatellus]|uniref:PDZ domain-containing protein n=1 Tax=Laodelphax striatellus TaxID=195883 RepID=A0A482X5K1_LAOST|nr:hypothetical protein LSTR_LSTR002669 [Laodelphax striatellus]
MDNSTSGIPEKRCLLLSNGPSFRRSTGSRPSSGGSGGGGGTLDLGGGTAPNHLPHTRIIVYSDEKGYGMKVSGDNPVYVQSVKEGGPAEKAGLHRGDKIIKVNGVTVTHSTHLEVVDLIKSSPYVELTVQQHPAHRSGSLTPSPSPTSPSSTMASRPSRPLHHHHSAPARDRITGPQPVDYKKQVHLEAVIPAHTIGLPEQADLIMQDTFYVGMGQLAAANSPRPSRRRQLAAANSPSGKLAADPTRRDQLHTRTDSLAF